MQFYLSEAIFTYLLFASLPIRMFAAGQKHFQIVSWNFSIRLFQ